MPYQDHDSLYKAFFEATLDGAAYCQMVFDEQGRPMDFIYEEVNNNFEEMTGLADVKGKKVTEIIPNIATSNPELFEIYGRVATTGKTEKFETYVGQLSKWFLVAAYSFERGFFMTAFSDITAQKQIVKDLEKFKLAADNVSDQIVIADPEGITLYINKATEKLTGYSSAEIMGKKVGTLWHFPMPKEFYQNLWKTIKTDKKTFVGELQNRRRNGEVYDAELRISPVLDEKNNVLFFVGIERDVSAEKKLIAEKSEALAKNESILSSIGEGLVVTDENGKITLINSLFESLTGWKRTDAMGKSFADLVPRQDESGRLIPWNERVLGQVLQGKVAIVSEAPADDKPAIAIPSSYFVRKDGTRFPITGVVSPIYFEGKIIGAVEVFHDITKERAVDRAKNEFVSLASHQLRTPPSIIGWYTETLQSGDLGPINEKQAEYLVEIYKANTRMIATINALLNISRIEMGTFTVSIKKVDIKSLIEHTIRELSSRFGHAAEWKKDYDPSVSKPIDADPNILRIIIDNLLSNAFKYSPPEHTKIEVTAKLENDSLFMSVKDNGIGIAQKDHDRIFEKLFRADNAVSTNPDGTGLGLYMTKKIVVDGLGGKIWFDSRENEGATFSVSLPASSLKEKTGTTTLARVKYYENDS